MAKRNKTEDFIVISLGGSLIVPYLSDEGGIVVQFLKKFRAFIVGEIKKGKRFIVVVGGGKTARIYQKAGRKVRAPADELDWLGIFSTKLNAQLLFAMFTKEAYSQIIDHEPSARGIGKLMSADKSLYIASGWVPGQSTDYVAVRLAQMFGAKEIINASNIAFAYDKDPRKYKDAKPIREISWREYRKLIPAKWSPGLSTPFDPTAAREAEKAKIKVKILAGSDLKNFRKAIVGKEFSGTIIS